MGLLGILSNWQIRIVKVLISATSHFLNSRVSIVGWPCAIETGAQLYIMLVPWLASMSVVWCFSPSYGLFTNLFGNTELNSRILFAIVIIASWRSG